MKNRSFFYISSFFNVRILVYAKILLVPWSSISLPFKLTKSFFRVFKQFLLRWLMNSEVCFLPGAFSDVKSSSSLSIFKVDAPFKLPNVNPFLLRLIRLPDFARISIPIMQGRDRAGTTLKVIIYVIKNIVATGILY